jgi:hypothetical protein
MENHPMTGKIAENPAGKRIRKMAREPEAVGSAEANQALHATTAKPKTKSTLVVELLQRPEGASLNELVAATGWLPHTTRAALTGLRKKGHAIAKDKVDGVTRYSIAPAATQ